MRMNAFLRYRRQGAGGKFDTHTVSLLLFLGSSITHLYSILLPVSLLTITTLTTNPFLSLSLYYQTGTMRRYILTQLIILSFRQPIRYRDSPQTN